jgi:alpha-galactosidase
MQIKRHVLVAITGVLLLGTGLLAQDSDSPSNHLAVTPPMGWNSWNKFACNVSEDMIKNMLTPWSRQA